MVEAMEIVKIAMAKSRGDSGVSHRPDFMCNCLAISHTY